jgi:hypothetical protein
MWCARLVIGGNIWMVVGDLMERDVRPLVHNLRDALQIPRCTTTQVLTACCLQKSGFRFRIREVFSRLVTDSDTAIEEVKVSSGYLRNR